MDKNKRELIQGLQVLRNIGPVAVENLYGIGIRTPERLKRSDPKMIYEKLKGREDGILDKCVLYQLQGAILDIPWPECKKLPENK